MMINLKKLYQSFKYAFRGFKTAVFEEQTFKIQLTIGVLVIILMFLLPLTSLERAVLFFTILLVLSLELFNSQLERILDIFNPKFNSNIKKIKDLSAGAVLLASLGSIIIGLLIFLPYVLK